MKAEEVEFGEWAIVELFGHRRAAGHVTQATFPAGFLRLDIPAADGHPASTQFYNPAAVYGLHPVSEDVARAAAASMRPEPVQRWELEPAGKVVDDHDAYPGDHDDDDWPEDDVEDEATEVANLNAVGASALGGER